MAINKRNFLEASSCTTLSWKNMRAKDDGSKVIDYEKEFKILEGIEIGEKARKLFSSGVMVAEKNIEKAIIQTNRILKDFSVKIIFEAAFSTEGLIARPDILVRIENNSFEMIEVKSSVNDKPELTDDMAYTGMVMQLGGINVQKYSLLLISKEYRLGMKDEQMFIRIDHTEDVRNKIIEIMVIKDKIRTVLESESEPKNPVSIGCRGCDYLEFCFPAYATTESIFNLPRLSEKQFIELTKLGIRSIRDIPKTFRLTDTQSFAWTSVKADRLIKLEKLGDMLQAIEWPVYYLDFESMMTAIPLFKETAPYTQIPTQFSIHRSEKIGTPSLHYEYLADKSGDCREKLTDALTINLGNRGTIFTYSSFEKTIIKGLMEFYPEKKTELNGILDRLSDLANIVKCTYHPKYEGSYSIKKTLPALVPSMNYDDLDINSGGIAMSVFALMIKGMIDAAKDKAIRQALLKYCERDTLAMVKLHEELSKL